MAIAYFDCFSGISGDMALGALMDCGVPVEALRAGLSSLPLSGWNLEAHPVLRNGIHALDVTISLDGKTDVEEQASAAGHHGHQHAHGRSMAEIAHIIESSHLSDGVKKTSLAIFRKIAEAEAYLHHSTPEEIHFHEIGGVDSLIDICGVAWCLEYLGVEQVHCSALPYSTGFVNCAHGRMPVPAPATLELLKNVPMIPTEIRGEMVTPTGAGIVATLSEGFGPPPAMRPRQIGFGSGKKQFPDRPNLLRVIIGELLPQPAATPVVPQIEVGLEGLEYRTLSVIESNIDDMNPEFYEYVFEKLFAAGALDVWMQPLHMKKTRPGVLLGALCDHEARAEVIAAMLRETTTLGVRVNDTTRLALPRESRTVDTPYGAMRVKVAAWPQGGLWRAVPEYSDVGRLAREHGVAAREVYGAAAANAEQELRNAREINDPERQQY